MTLIDNITSSPNQQMNLILPDNSVITDFTMTYMDNPQAWFMSMTYGSFVINNFLVSVNPNMLSQFDGVIPFGIGCDTTDGYEPIFINDFSNGRASLYLLDEDDIEEVLETLTPGYNSVMPGFIPWGN